MNSKIIRNFGVFIVLFIVLTSCIGCIESVIGNTATVHFTDGTEKQYKGVDSLSYDCPNGECINNVAILGIVGSRDGVYLKRVEYIEIKGEIIEFDNVKFEKSRRNRGTPVPSQSHFR